MKALILGITGFAGPFLAHNLIKKGFTVSGTDFKGVPFNDASLKSVEILPCDITDRKQVEETVSQVKPDRVFILAGFTSPRLSFQNPQAAFNINTIGTVNIIQSCKKHCPESKILFVSTGNFYDIGRHSTITEKTKPGLTNPYAISKFAAEEYIRMEASNSGLNVVIARPFNHTGPGQLPVFAVPSFATQILEASKKSKEDAVIKTGNTNTFRDFTDVRDIAECYRLCSEKGIPGEVYNIASGKAVRISDMLDNMLAISGTNVRTEVDPERCMPEPEGSFKVDLTKVRTQTGWEPKIELSRTIEDIFTWLKIGKRSLEI